MDFLWHISSSHLSQKRPLRKLVLNSLWSWKWQFPRKTLIPVYITTTLGIEHFRTCSLSTLLEMPSFVQFMKAIYNIKQGKKKAECCNPLLHCINSKSTRSCNPDVTIPLFLIYTTYTLDQGFLNYYICMYFEFLKSDSGN